MTSGHSALRSRGMTMIELMVSLVLGLIVIATAISMFMASSQVAGNLRGQSAVNDSGQNLISYFSMQLRNAGYIDLLERDGQWAILNQTDNQAVPTTGDGSNLAQVVNTTHPGLFTLHGCNQAYRQPHLLLNYDCPPGGDNTAASLSLAHQVLASPASWLAPSLASALNLNRGFQTDCGGRATRFTDNNLANPAGDVALNRYYLDKTSKRLMCIGNGDPNTPVQIAANIEQFQVLYGITTTDPSGGEMLKNYVTADQINSLVGGWSSVVALQLCVLAVGEPGSAQNKSNIFNVDCTGQAIDTRDSRLRRAHRAIIHLRNASHSATALP